MENSTLKAGTVYILLALLLCLGICDGWLLIRLKRQEKMVADLKDENAYLMQAPQDGQLVPLVQGISLHDNRPLAIQVKAAHRLLLLVFSTNCRYCEDNWKSWDKLSSSTSSSLPVNFVTADPSLTESYVGQHPMLRHRDVLLAVDPAVLQAFHVLSTPQTIYIVDGHVKRDWVGVLTRDDIDEISKL